MEREGNSCVKGKPWGFIAKEVHNPSGCITECRRRFLRSLSPKFQTFKRICEHLQFDQTGNPSHSQDKYVKNRAEVNSSEDFLDTRHSAQKQPTTDHNITESLWSLYCCDAQSCGVNHLKQSGLDREYMVLFCFIYFAGQPNPSMTRWT